MQSDFSPEYAMHLGFKDAREYGSKHPHRSFVRGAGPRDDAYFHGLDHGLVVTKALGLDMRCIVHWDNPGFYTPECGKKATHMGFWDINDTTTAALFLCRDHALVAQFLHEPAKPAHWAVVPISWL